MCMSGDHSSHSWRLALCPGIKAVAAIMAAIRLIPQYLSFATFTLLAATGLEHLHKAATCHDHTTFLSKVDKAV